VSHNGETFAMSLDLGRKFQKFICHEHYSTESENFYYGQRKFDLKVLEKLGGVVPLKSPR